MKFYSYSYLGKDRVLLENKWRILMGGLKGLVFIKVAYQYLELLVLFQRIYLNPCRQRLITCNSSKRLTFSSILITMKEKPIREGKARSLCKACG